MRGWKNRKLFGFAVLERMLPPVIRVIRPDRQKLSWGGTLVPRTGRTR